MSEYFERRNYAIAHCTNGTIIFHDDTATDDELLEILSVVFTCPILSVYINSMTDTFCFDYFQDGKRIRTSWFSDVQPEINQEKGTPFEWENEKNRTENIFKGILSRPFVRCVLKFSITYPGV